MTQLNSENSSTVTALLKATSPQEWMLHKTRLEYLALNFDPFDVHEISSECMQIISYYQLEPFLNDPYKFTSLLLLWLDQVDQNLSHDQHP
jgi:hypothetical protein